MQELKVSGKELLVVASKLGAKDFPGIPNPFLGMEKPDIWLELPEIQANLEKAGYASMGFEGGFCVKKDVQEMIAVCAFCEKYMMIDSIQDSEIKPKKVFYQKEDHAVILEESGTGYVMRTSCGDDLMTSLLENELLGLVNSAVDDEKIVSKTLLKDIAELDEKEMKAKFASSGISSDMAEFLYKGFSKKANYCSLMAVDLLNKKSKSLICILSERGALRLMPFYDNLEDELKISWISIEETKAILQEML